MPKWLVFPIGLSIAVASVIFLSVIRGREGTAQDEWRDIRIANVLLTLPPPSSGILAHDIPPLSAGSPHRIQVYVAGSREQDAISDWPTLGLTPAAER